MDVGRFFFLASPDHNAYPICQRSMQRTITISKIGQVSKHPSPVCDVAVVVMVVARMDQEVSDRAKTYTHWGIMISEI